MRIELDQFSRLSENAQEMLNVGLRVLRHRLEASQDIKETHLMV